MISLISFYFNDDIFLTYDQSCYEVDLSFCNLAIVQCPCCNAVGFFKNHARYFRYFSNSAEPLSIKRIRCQKCGTTHALLPEIIIPYRYFSSCIILKLFSLYLKGNLSISKLQSALNISRQAIERLIKFFHLFHEELLYIANPFLKLDFDFFFQRDYFSRYHFFFIQSIHHKHRHYLHMEIIT